MSEERRFCVVCQYEAKGQSHLCGPCKRSYNRARPESPWAVMKWAADRARRCDDQMFASIKQAAKEAGL